MSETFDTKEPARPLARLRRLELAPLGWIAVGLLLLAVELVGLGLIPPAPNEIGRAVWVIGAALLHAVAILVGTLLVATLPRRHHAVRRVVSRLSVAIFGFATLASHGWVLWVIFARVHAAATGWPGLDPILDVVGGLYVAFGWLVFLALVALAAWIARAVTGPRDA
ncbi:MAG: hypothetical protein GX458_21025 [Phyllobacteriaceae bacterium]|nr:hypothetical protein [Phyllobacteriaceae bacterium]